MKHLSILILLLLTWQLSSQNDIQIYLDQSEGSSNPHLTHVKQKLTSSLASQKVFLANDASLPLVLQAKLISLGLEDYSGGMALKKMEKLSLQLALVHQSSGWLVDAVDIKLSGTGNNAREARRNAIEQLSPRQAKLKLWANQLSNKVEGFYQSNCDLLMEEAEKAFTRQDYRKAFSMADGIPNDVSCSNHASLLAETAYRSFQRHACDSLLQAARLALAQAKANDAVDMLAQIDPEAPCAAEVKTLLSEVSTELSKQRSNKANFLRQVYNNQVKIEEARTQTKRAILSAKQD